MPVAIDIPMVAYDTIVITIYKGKEIDYEAEEKFREKNKDRLYDASKPHVARKGSKL